MMRIETSPACVMCGGDDAQFPVGTRWMCRPDAERLAWHWAEIRAVAELCEVSPHQLGTVLTR
jgi:hypothetical protein